MKLSVLVDNNTYIDQYYCGEPAVSYYIEVDEFGRDFYHYRLFTQWHL